jgi:hypothetical protein
MEIRGLGVVRKDRRLKWYHRSKPIPVPVLGNKKCEIVVSRYDMDDDKEDFHVAIANFLSIPPSVLKEAAPHVFQYYRECKADHGRGEKRFVKIASAGKVFDHVRLGSKPIVQRRGYGDKGIYISLECECDWEQEHGLQIVFKNGLKVNKVGPYDGHLSNADAYDNKKLEKVIFAPW